MELAAQWAGRFGTLHSGSSVHRAPLNPGSARSPHHPRSSAPSLTPNFIPPHPRRAIPEPQLLGAGFSALVSPVLEPLSTAMTPFPPSPASSAPLREKLPLLERLSTLLRSLDRQAAAAEALRRCGPQGGARGWLCR
jgi:hypothetical protein